MGLKNNFIQKYKKLTSMKPVPSSLGLGLGLGLSKYGSFIGFTKLVLAKANTLNCLTWSKRLLKSG